MALLVGEKGGPFGIVGEGQWEMGRWRLKLRILRGERGPLVFAMLPMLGERFVRIVERLLERPLLEGEEGVIGLAE